MTHIWSLLCPQTPAQLFAPRNTSPSPLRDETLAGTAPGPGLRAKARHRPAAAERLSRPRKAFWRRRPRAALWLSSCGQRRGPAHRTRVKLCALGPVEAALHASGGGTDGLSHGEAHEGAGWPRGRPAGAPWPHGRRGRTTFTFTFTPRGASPPLPWLRARCSVTPAALCSWVCLY